MVNVEGKYIPLPDPPAKSRINPVIRLGGSLPVCATILTASLFLGCASVPASQEPSDPAPTGTALVETETQSRFPAARELETATIPSPSSATRSSTPETPTPYPTATPAPAATATPAPTPTGIPSAESPAPVVQAVTPVNTPALTPVHGVGAEPSQATPSPGEGGTETRDPGAIAGDLDIDSQVRPLPEKGRLKYPNLGSTLNQMVASVEAGQASAREAAEGAAMHQGESVAVTIYLNANVAEVAQFLWENGGDPRNVGEDYIEAYFPILLLGQLSQQPGVLRVREIVPPQPG